MPRLPLALALTLTATAAFADDDLDARLGRGELVITTRTVPGAELPEVTLQGVVDAAPERVWKVIDDCSGYKRTLPRIADSKELWRKPGGAAGTSKVSCEIVFDMPFPFSDLTAVNEADHVVGPPAWSRTWRLLRGDYERNEGSWTLTPFGEGGKRTKVVYKLLAVPKVSIPNALLRKAQTGALPDLMHKLRESCR
jgi:uncharacterized protein YndB with AHSA1/START domain